MIARIHPRGVRIGGLLAYLFGPGRKEDHTRPRLVAAWDGAGDLTGLEPPVTANGRRDVRALTAMLEDPVRAGFRPPRKPVWHCSLRLAPGDRVLTDQQWAHVAAEVMAQAGLAAFGDDGAIRWVAVRHADDHVHIAATLVRQDRRTEWARNDYRRVRAAVLDLERRYGLRSTAPIDGTAPRRPNARELNKAARQSRAEVPRDRLRREVRAAAAVAADEHDFITRLRRAGVLVRLRHSSIDPTQVTGYAVGWPDHHTKAGQPVWYGGGRLAPDLTLPRLRTRWAAEPVGTPARSQHPPDDADRQRAYQRAADTIRHAAEGMRTDPGSADTIADAAADILAATAYTARGRHAAALNEAAELFDRAARRPYGIPPPATPRRVGDLRAMARLVWVMGQLSEDRTSTAMLQLVYSLAMLADNLADLREAQQRVHQARAARAAARHLRGISTPISPGQLGAFEPVPTRAPVHLHETYAARQRPRGRGR